jgi:hypothetical protein
MSVEGSVFGGKITSLVNVRNGREWLVSARRTVHRPAAESRMFGSDEAYGWDEMFPSILACFNAEWWGEVPDHGELWWRDWQLEVCDPSYVSLVASGQDWVFRRALRLAHGRLTCSYILENLSLGAIPFMWSMHPILAVLEGDSIVGVHGTTTVSGVWDGTVVSEHRESVWPSLPGMVEGDLSTVSCWDGTTCLKIYAGPFEPGDRVSVGSQDDWVSFHFCGDVVRYLGIYLNYGGWPAAGSDLYQIGIEPTTAPVDHLREATETHQERILPSATSVSWDVTVDFAAPEGNPGGD